MKKITLIVLVFSIAITSYSQKKKKRTIYTEHPAIVMVEAMQQAEVLGDIEKLDTYLADDFKEYNGSGVDNDDKGTDKEQFLKNVEFRKDVFSYVSVERMKGAFPDALEYKEGEDGEDEIWVQTWDMLKGVHNKTGDKINMPMHRLYKINGDNKIATMIGYYNDEVFADIGRSFDVRENGVIYDNHEYINSVKMAFAAFENNDLEKAYSFFSDDARFRGSTTLPGDKSTTLDELKASNAAFLEMYTIVAIDMNGYPDYLHYERGNMDLVQSWWTFKLIRKSDDKKFILPAFYTHTFNDEGKIRFGNSYINLKLLDD